MKSIISLILLLGSCATSFSFASTLDEQRALYQQLSQASVITAEALNNETLQNYPLYPYLKYRYLSQHRKQLNNQDIEAFVAQYPHTFASKRLTDEWLNYLGASRQWQAFNQLYQEGQASTAQRCYHLQSQLLNYQERPQVFSKVSELWLSASSLPSACDSLFRQWRQQGYLTHSLAWQRFQLSYSTNNKTLARYLVRFLDNKQQQLANMALGSTRHSAALLKLLQQPNIPFNADMGVRILRNIATRNEQYLAVAQLVEAQPAWLNAEQLAILKRVSAWHLARVSGAEASQWLQQVGAEQQTELNDVQLRYALQAQDWPLYQKLFHQFSSVTYDSDEWLYWQTIAQQKMGIINDDDLLFTPNAILARLATKRSFYGFLAAEQQRVGISMRPPGYTEEPLSDADIEKRLAPALELYQLGKLASANQEWRYVTQNFSQTQWLVAGWIAKKYQWHDKTIQAFAQAEHWDAIDARFPLAWHEQFYKYSLQTGVEQSWLLAMARQESGFSPLARSAVGAVGVLQLMPATAKRVTKELGEAYNEAKLTETEYNIRLGSHYLSKQLKQFDNNYILATAAYNAGPKSVRQWLKVQNIEDDWVLWVATIPFAETRDYVKNILTYSRIYQERLGRQNPQLSLLALAKHN